MISRGYRRRQDFVVVYIIAVRLRGVTALGHVGGAYQAVNSLFCRCFLQVVRRVKVKFHFGSIVFRHEMNEAIPELSRV